MDHSSCQIKQTIFANPDKELEIPTIYACATMWHETKAEMMELNKSLFRMDQDQMLLKEKNDISGKIHQNFYKFESKHIYQLLLIQEESKQSVLLRLTFTGQAEMKALQILFIIGNFIKLAQTIWYRIFKIAQYF